MRTADKEKKQRVDQAVLTITKREGIQALSFSKIAREAAVSSGTPYVYYQDKTDMLGQIYLAIKNRFDTGLAADIARGQTLEARVYNGVMHFLEMDLNYPLEATFMTEINNNPKLVTAATVEAGMRQAAPLFALYDEAKATGRLRVEDMTEVVAMLFGPPQMLLAQWETAGEQARIGPLQHLTRLAIQALLQE